MFATSSPSEIPDIVMKFIEDPQVSPDLKAVCFRLASHKFMQKMLENTPVSAIFWICEEYKKHPDLYDDIFNGKIKFYQDGKTQKFLPVFDRNNINNSSNLKNLFDTDALTRQIVEKFVTFDQQVSNVRRIAVEVNGDKMVTVAFNSEKKIISMFIDFVNSGKFQKSAFLNYLCKDGKKRIDFIRV